MEVSILILTVPKVETPLKLVNAYKYKNCLNFRRHITNIRFKISDKTLFDFVLNIHPSKDIYYNTQKST